MKEPHKSGLCVSDMSHYSLSTCSLCAQRCPKHILNFPCSYPWIGHSPGPFSGEWCLEQVLLLFGIAALSLSHLPGR